MDVKFGKNQNKTSHVASRLEYFEWLANNIKIPGIVSVSRDNAFDDNEMRNAGIRLQYKSHFSSLHGVKDGILIEVGHDATTPNRAMAISSWAFDRAATSGILFKDTHAVDVKCYCMEYTFVEKLQTVSTKFRQQQMNGSMPNNFMRHYYDLHQLLAQPDVLAFLGTSKYEEYKKLRFRTGDILKISENEAFLLNDTATRKLYADEYRKTASLYYNGQVPFEDILKRIREHIEQL
jgi:hypothetical protein